MVKKTSILYYIIMLLILISWNNPEALPPLPFRLVFLVLLIGPMLLQKSKLLPFVLLTFVVVSASSYAVSYMPVDGLYLFITCLLSSLILGLKNSNFGLSIPYSFIVLTTLSFVLDFLYSESITISYCWLVVILISRFFIEKNNNKYLQIAAFSFAVISIVLSIEFLTVGDKFVRDVHTVLGDLDRKGWTDPNYFGSVIGMGILISLIEIIHYRNNVRLKAFYLLTFILSIYTLISTASRGATVALFVAIIALLFFSKVQFKYKTCAFLFVVVLLIVMYQLHMLDLLLIRFFSDEGDLGGREYIWMIRLSHFISDLNIFQWLFGIGNDQALTLGTGRVLGFHNDFLAVLVSYGFIGLGCLISMLIYPIRNANKRNRPIVFTLIIYISLCMCSIEPFSGGQWGCLYFYIFILMLNQIRYEENTVRY